MNLLKWIAWVFVMIGGINWGLYGLFKFNLIEAILGTGFLSRFLFILVGIGALYLIYLVYQTKQAM